MVSYAQILQAMQDVRPGLQELPVAGPPPPFAQAGFQADERLFIERKDLYERFREVFIVHVLAPSEREGQDYDIFIYLKRHFDEPISDVTRAEFFFGPYWGNRIFEGEREGDVIGVRLSAYGSFLCTCRVTFEDGEQVNLYRYIDFEMGKVIAGLA